MTDKHLRCLIHGLGIKGAEHAPGAMALKRERAAAVDNAVEVMTGFGPEARIEIGSHGLAGEDRDRIRPQHRIQGIAHGVVRPFLGEVEMSNLAKSMAAAAPMADTARRAAKKPAYDVVGVKPEDVPDAEGDELAAVEGDEAPASGDDDETFLEEEEEDGSDMDRSSPPVHPRR